MRSYVGHSMAFPGPPIALVTVHAGVSDDRSIAPRLVVALAHMAEFVLNAARHQYPWQLS